MKTIGIIGLVASVAATVGAQTEQNVTVVQDAAVAAQEEAFKLKHYIAHNVIGITEEEEQNMSLKEMAKRYNKVKKFIPPVAEEENLSVEEIHQRYVDEMARRYTREMAKRYTNIKGSNPKSEEEEAFKLKHYIAHNVIGITEEEEQNMSLKEMAKRYKKVKKFLPKFEEEEDIVIAQNGLTEEEENMSLKEMAKRYNKVKKFIPPVAEEEAFVPAHYIIPKVPIRKEEEAFNFGKFLKEKIIGK